MNNQNQRSLEFVEETKEIYSQYQKCDRWAVLVGISQYKHQPWSLNYADRDAEELCQFLRSENGGEFKEENIYLLTNQKATKSNIEDALYSFLQKPDKDDLVIIFFACHGAPDPNRPGNIYLLPYDTDPNKIAARGIPMSRIDEVLKTTLISNKVIIFADTCHSGNIGGKIGNRNAGDQSELINKYLQDLTQASEGIALLTSAEAREVAREGPEWGGGHGVFTHFVLEGMKGAADRDKNGIITVGELFEYVRENVKQATENKQHPSIGTNPYDRNLPIAIDQKVIKTFYTKTTDKNKSQQLRKAKGNDEKYRVQELTNGIILEMVKIPSGQFQMGSPENGYPSEEKPQHSVKIPSFWMGKYLITQEQWRIVAEMDIVSQDLNPNPSNFPGDKLPVEKVSWYDAMEFCARISLHTGLKYRLPSEAEWEYACRSKTKTPWFFGSLLGSKYARFGDPQGRTVSVGNFPPNQFGIYDMHGNTWEWCADTWHENYENAPNNGNVWDENHQEINYYQNTNENLVELLNDDRWRVVRGGSWADSQEQCRSAFRIDQSPNASGNTLGLRVVFTEN